MVRLVRFLRQGLWEIDLRQRAWPSRFALAILRVICHTVATYGSHLVGIRASGLTLVTLLSIVPLLAVGFAIAGAFGFRETLEGALAANAEDLPDHLAAALRQIGELVQRTSFKALGGIGTLLLLWVGLSLFTRVEQSLNFAWRTSGDRAWLRRMTSFVALVVIVPVLMVGALAITAALNSGSLVERLRLDLPLLMAVYDAGLWMVPHLMAVAALTCLYRFMPSTEVRWRSALFSGVFAGITLLAMHEVYVHFQIGVARANAIYATLAALPLLLVYLQVIWTIVLLGAEAGYAVQNLHLIGPERDPGDLAPALRERIALRLVDRAVTAHARGERPLSLTAEAQATDVPREWLESVVEDLEGAGVLVATRHGAVVPARSGAGIRVVDVQDVVRGRVDDRLAARLALSGAVEETCRQAEEARERAASKPFQAVVEDAQDTA